MEKLDGRTTILKGVKGHLLSTNPGKEWAEILVELLAKHGNVKAVARAINVTEQVVYDWVGYEVRAGKIKVKRQPPRVWELV
jgi:transposase-like protein